MSVYFLAYRGRSLLSRFIRFATAGDYSHVGLAVSLAESGDIKLWSPADGERPELEFGAWGSAFRPWDVKVRLLVIDEEHRPGTQVDVYRLPCTRDEADKILDFFLEHEGAPYDFVGALTSLVRPSWQGKKKFFCSELAYAACLSAGARLLNEDRPYKVTPRIFCLSPYLKKFGQFQTRRV